MDRRGSVLGAGTSAFGRGGDEERRRSIPYARPVAFPRRIPAPLFRAFLLGVIAPLAVAWALMRQHHRATEVAEKAALRATQVSRDAPGEGGLEGVTEFVDIDEVLGNEVDGGR